MLPLRNRLNLSKAPKDRIFSGQKLSSDEFRVIAKFKPGVFKVATSVSKKVARLAVDRNRIKRIITESLRGQSIYEGEFLIIVNKNIAHLKKYEVKDKLFSLLGRLK